MAVGDIIIVKAGERIPLDGVVISGESMIDTSALTGESVPRSAREGTQVISGCVNGSGLLKIEVTKEFEDSTVSRILELVENASSKKAKVEILYAACGDCGCASGGCSSSCSGPGIRKLDSAGLYFPRYLLSVRTCYISSA